MKVRTSRPLALSALLALLLLLWLGGSVDAHEDPREADKRGQPTISWLQDQYREQYMFKGIYPKPLRPKLLTEYSATITTIIDKLARFGTRKWDPSEYYDIPSIACCLLKHGCSSAFLVALMPDDDAIVLIRRLETATKATLVNSMHPDLIASQPKAVRKQHFSTMQKFVDWLHEHFDEIANLEDKKTTEVRLNRYNAILDLAAAGAMVPHG